MSPHFVLNLLHHANCLRLSQLYKYMALPFSISSSHQFILSFILSPTIFYSIQLTGTPLNLSKHTLHLYQPWTSTPAATLCLIWQPLHLFVLVYFPCLLTNIIRSLVHCHWKFLSPSPPCYMVVSPKPWLFQLLITVLSMYSSLLIG